MNQLKISALLIATLAISGCSGFFVGKSNIPKPAPISGSTTSSLVRASWIASGLGSSKNTSLRFVVANDGGSIYVANANGTVSALDANSGSRRWSKKIKALYSGVATNGGFVYVGTKSGKLVALSSANGEVAWSVDLYGAPLTAPVIADSRVIIRTVGGAVESFDAQTGDKSWAYLVQVPDINMRGGTAPVVVGNNLLVPTDLGLIGYLRADTGAVIWGQKVSNPRNGTTAGRLADMDAIPVIDNNIAYVPVVGTGVAAISLKNGFKMWETKTGSYSGLTHDGARLYVAYGNGNIGALSKRDGKAEWESTDLYARQLTRPVLINDRIVVGDHEGYVHVLDKSSGQLLGSTKIGRAGFMPDTLMLNGSAIFQDYSGNAYRISL